MPKIISYSEVYKKPIDNYMYFYHTDTLIILPKYPDGMSESNPITMQATSILGRSAPIYTFASAGPRSLLVTMNNMHRDMLRQVNNGNIDVMYSKYGDDYIGLFINQIYTAVLPEYADASKMINPPTVALRVGDLVYIKGVIKAAGGITYNKPIIINKNGLKLYSSINTAFTIEETNPFSASLAMAMGPYRNLDGSLEKKIELARKGLTSTTDSKQTTKLGSKEYEFKILHLNAVGAKKVYDGGWW